MSFQIIPLNSTHRKTDFECGKNLMDDYFHKQASQDIKRRLAACFVLAEDTLVKGYYTLSNSSIQKELLPEEIQKKLPSYSNLPVTLLGRLAVDKRFHKKGLGEIMLIDALKRSLEVSTSIGSMAVIVDPLDDDARKFYSKYGFILLPDSGKMFLSMKAIKVLFAQ